MPARSMRFVRICRGDDSSSTQCKSQKFYYIEKKPGDFLRNHPVFSFQGSAVIEHQGAVQEQHVLAVEVQEAVQLH